MDEELAHRVATGLRSGDPDAWRQLYDAFAERVWRGVARLLGPHPADIADVVQETMLAAARSVRNFDGAKGSLWNWLWGIARTQVALHFRQRRRHDRWKWDALTRPEGTEALHESGIEINEVAEAVRAALGELPAEYEQLLTAKYSDGDSVERIAGRERLTETAVRSKLARARAAFRAAYLRMNRHDRNTTEVARELP